MAPKDGDEDIDESESRGRPMDEPSGKQLGFLRAHQPCRGAIVRQDQLVLGDLRHHVAAAGFIPINPLAMMKAAPSDLPYEQHEAH